MFTELTGEIDGPLDVPGAVHVHGTVHGDVTVTGTLRLSGRVLGTLSVQLDGMADVDAAVAGNILVQGNGRLDFRGIVDGGLRATPGTEVLLAAGTVVSGNALQQDGSFRPARPGVPFTFTADTPRSRLQDDGSFSPV